MSDGKKHPDYDAFSVVGTGQNANWTRIGAAWKHPKGDGFNIVLTALPMPSLQTETAKVVLMPFKPRERENTQEQP